MTDEKEPQENRTSEPDEAREAQGQTTEPDEGAAAGNDARPQPEGAAATPPPPAPPPPPPPPVAERRLVRRPEGKMIAGVCSGLGAYTGVDPVAWRIGFVVLTLVSGVGLIAYIVAWLVMPMARAGDPFPPPPSDPTRLRRWVGIGAVVIGAVVLFRNAFQIHGAIFWGLLLIGVGLALWGWEWSGRDTHSERPARPLPPPPPPAPPPSGPVSPPAAQETTPLPATPTAPAPSPKRREPSMLGRLVVGAAALAVGVALLLDNLEVIELSARGVLLGLLVITGVGLLVGSVWGRARWLIFPGLGLILVLAGVSYVPTDRDGTFGNITWQPRSPSELRDRYEHSFGNGVLDLTRVPIDRPRTVDLRVRFGNLEVVVPEDVPVVVRGRVRFGDLDVFGREYSGLDVRDEVHEPGDPDLGPLTLVADVAFGNTEIRRVRPGERDPRRAGDNDVRVRIGPGMELDVQSGGNGS